MSHAVPFRRIILGHAATQYVPSRDMLHCNIQSSNAEDTKNCVNIAERLDWYGNCLWQGSGCLHA